jgi:hypothetical protein
MRDRFSADPTVVFMTAVLDDIAEGRLQIPRFQRPLVWRWDQRRDLLSSIFEGLPIGALMIWISGSEPVERYEKLGPYLLPKPTPGSENRYVMDGIQRLSTLFGALRAQEDWVDMDDEEDQAVADFVVYVDLDAEEDQERFIREVDLPRTLRVSDPSRFLPLRNIVDSRDLLRFQRSVPQGKEERIDAADEVAAAFRQYKIPIITLNSASLETVTKSFQRVNSRGSIMSEMHMINALTFSNEFDLLRIERELRRDVLSEVGWDGIDQDVILRALKLHLGVEFYTPKPEELGRKLKQRPEALNEIFGGLAQVAAILRANVGIASHDLIPYKLQLIALAELGSRVDLKIIADDLFAWFWMSTYTEAFGASARQSENAIDDLRRYTNIGDFTWSGRSQPSVRSLIGRKLDFRSARGKALGLALAIAKEESGGGAVVELLNRYHGEAFCNASSESTTRGRVGFRFVLQPAELPQFKQRLWMGELTPSEKQQNLISEDAESEMALGNDVGFALAREQDIFEYEMRRLINPAFEHLHLLPPALLAQSAGAESL